MIPFRKIQHVADDSVGRESGCEENNFRSGTKITLDLSAARAISDDQPAIK